MPSKNTIPYRFILLVILFAAADFIIDRVNHRSLMGDFQVYYGAANAISHNGQVYGALFSPGSGYYKYSPFMAFMFYPLSVLPYYAASMLNLILISAATIVASILILHILNTYVFGQPLKYVNSILSLAVLLISMHLARELGLGNVNMVLLLLLCLSLYYVIQNKQGIAGLMLALVIITKPFFVIVLIPLLIRRYFKTVFTSALWLGIFAILPAFLLGINKDIELHRQWLNTMLIHADGFPSPNTIGAIIKSDLHVNLSDSFQYVVMVFFMELYVLYVWMNRVKEKVGKPGKYSNLIMEWFILIAMIPSLFKTDTEHFLMTLPLLVFMVAYLFNNRSVWQAVFFIAVAFLYAVNSPDLLGGKLSAEMTNVGVLGIGNLLLVGFALSVYTIKAATFKIPGFSQNTRISRGTYKV